MNWLKIGKVAAGALMRRPEFAGIAGKFLLAAERQLESDEVAGKISRHSEKVLVGAAECQMGLIFHLSWIWLAVEKAKTPEGRQWLHEMHSEHGAPFPGDTS